MTRLGVIFSQADSGTDPDAIRAWARRAEQAGFEHIMIYDHVLGASVERLGAGPFGGPFPAPPYTSEHTFHEALTLISHLAGASSTIAFVTSVLILPQRQTALAAKQIATVDLLSGGRLRVAVGTGWNRAEYEGLGADFESRRDRLEEQVDVLRRLWTEPLVSFSGRFHELDRVGINPLPSRPIPIYVGSGAADPVLRRVVRIADGWMPLLIPDVDRRTLAQGVARLGELCAEAGRDPATLPIHGRVYLGAGWQSRVEQALELGCADLSVGFNRLAEPGRSHDEHLDAVIAAKEEWTQSLAAKEDVMTEQAHKELLADVLSRYAASAELAVREISEAAERHLHAFIEEVGLQRDEWFAGIQFLTATGQKCDETRQEFILLSDTLGVSALVEFVTHGGTEGTTENTVLGPFYVPGSPVRARGESMLVDPDDGDRVVIRGTVTDDAGTPLAGATLDCWQNATAGSYAVQQPGVQSADNLRGIYLTDDDGTYEIRSVRPMPYSIPFDGPVGDLLRANGRGVMRPGHTHMWVRSPGCKELITHVFDAETDYLHEDAVFGVRPSLVRQFVPDDNGELVATFDVVLDRLP